MIVMISSCIFLIIYNYCKKIEFKPFHLTCLVYVTLRGLLRNVLSQVFHGEAKRVLRKGGVLVCEAISRYASTVDGFIEGLGTDPDFFEILTRDLKTGYHRDTSKIQRYFTDAYFHFPQELVDELVEAKLEFTDLISVEAFGYLVPDLGAKLEDEGFRSNLLSTICLVERNRDIMGISSHFMGIATRS